MARERHKTELKKKRNRGQRRAWQVRLWLLSDSSSHERLRLQGVSVLGSGCSSFAAAAKPQSTHGQSTATTRCFWLLHRQPSPLLSPSSPLITVEVANWIWGKIPRGDAE
jgi:hypothetical protein